jgi:tetratricopeptide (TPR) repeat protein
MDELVTQRSMASGGVFISYRRQDAAPYARLLREELRRHYGAEHVFMDVDSIDVGVDFADAIAESVEVCQVLLALIGKNWLTAADVNGSRRLDDPDDTVRLEIEAALNRGIRVVPILVDGALMPRRQELPPELAPLARRNALELSYNRFEYELERLVEAVDRVIGQPSTAVADSSGSTPGPPFTEATRVASDLLEQLVRQAEAARVAGRHQEALRDFDRYLQMAPDDALALRGRGETYRVMERHQEALRDFDRSLQLEPDSAFALRGRGATYLVMGRHQDALQDLDRSLQSAPDDAWALKSRGETYRVLGRHQEALRDFDRSLQLAPDDSWALRQRALIPR